MEIILPFEIGDIVKRRAETKRYAIVAVQDDLQGYPMYIIRPMWGDRISASGVPTCIDQWDLRIPNFWEKVGALSDAEATKLKRSTKEVRS